MADYLGYIDATIEALDGEGDDLASIRDALASALASLRTATDWLLANGPANPLDALAGATPYLRLFSLVTGGWVMAQQAVKARAAMADADATDKAFYEGKVLTARFFCEQILPQAHGLVPAVTATNRDLAAAVLSGGAAAAEVVDVALTLHDSLQPVVGVEGGKVTRRPLGR